MPLSTSRARQSPSNSQVLVPSIVGWGRRPASVCSSIASDREHLRPHSQRAGSRLGQSSPSSPFARSSGAPSPTNAKTRLKQDDNSWCLPSVGSTDWRMKAFLEDESLHFGHPHDNVEKDIVTAQGGDWNSSAVCPRTFSGDWAQLSYESSEGAYVAQWQPSSARQWTSPHVGRGGSFMTANSISPAWTEVPSTCEPCNTSYDNLMEDSRILESSRFLSFAGGCSRSCCSHDEPSITVTSAGRGGNTIQVPQPPVHSCMAFTSDDPEGDRQRQAQKVPALLNPKTKRLFQEIQSLGQFPPRRGPRAWGARQ